MKIGRCAYCGENQELTREHLLTTGLRGDPASNVSIFPPMGRHRFGQQVVLKDVCKQCNNERLGSLDEFALNWTRTPPQEPHPDGGGRLLRWCAKWAYNSKRAPATDKVDPRPLPPALPRWIIGVAPENPGFRAIVAWMHPERDVGISYGEAADDPLLEAALVIHEWLFVLAWEHPNREVSLDARIRSLAERFPGRELREGSAIDARYIPRIREADWPYRGLLKSLLEDMQEAARRSAKRSKG